VKQGTFKYIEQLLRDYPEMDNYIKQREEELIFPDELAIDQNIGGGRSSFISKPTERMAITITEDKRLQMLIRYKRAIDKLIDEVAFFSVKMYFLRCAGFVQVPADLLAVGIPIMRIVHIIRSPTFLDGFQYVAVFLLLPFPNEKLIIAVLFELFDIALANHRGRQMFLGHWIASQLLIVHEFVIVFKVHLSAHPFGSPR